MFYFESWLVKLSVEMDDRNDSLIENNEQQNEENIFPDYDTQSELSLEMSEDHFSIDDSNQLDGSVSYQLKNSYFIIEYFYYYSEFK